MSLTPSDGSTNIHTSLIFIDSILNFMASSHLSKSNLCTASVGFRCGVVTISQIPIIVLLASKNNIVGCLSGISYERLNWIHRWCARCMLFTATMHMGWFFSAWAPYDYIGYQLKNSNIAWKGLAAWCTLFWMVFSSMTPIRGWSYEVFVIQHIISFAAFLAFVSLHTPVERHGYVWVPVAIYLLDRLMRALRHTCSLGSKMVSRAQRCATH